MLVGHFAVAFVGKRIEPKISLGTLMLASMLPDLLWPIFSIAGIEYTAEERAGADASISSIPISHSLLMVAIWASLLSGAYLLRRQCLRGSVILFLVVISHWLLDSISHKHTLAPGIDRHLGLGLWNSLPATIIVEGGFWLLAIILYIRSEHASRRAGIYLFWPVIAFLTLVWITNIRNGPPPPSAVIGSLIFFSLIVAWAYWMNLLRSASTDTAEITKE
ncbi:MAG TPA: hypothetical protein VID27_22270 [Blastocatellia bacterium]|jgi:hypothetical protein